MDRFREWPLSGDLVQRIQYPKSAARMHADDHQKRRTALRRNGSPVRFVIRGG